MKKNRRNVIRIGVISTYPDRKDGISEYITDLAGSIKKNNPHGFQFVYIPLQSIFFSIRQVRTLNIRTGRGFNALLKKIRENNLDVVHMHYGSTFLGFNPKLDIIQHINLYYFLRNLQIPVIITAHMYFEHDSPLDKLIRYFVTKRIAALSHVVLVLHSEIERNKLVKIAGSKAARRIVYIPHGFPKELTEITNKERSLSLRIKRKYHLEGKTILSSLGLIADWKGNMEVLKNISSLLQKTPNIKYVIAGSSINSKKYAEQCKKFIKKNDLEAKVVFLDKYLTRSEMKSILQITDIYLSYHLYNKHSSSGTIIFALASGCVVFSNNIQFVQGEIISQRLVICTSDSDYKQKIEALVGNKEKLNYYRSETNKISNRFSWNRVSQDYTALFKSRIAADYKIKEASTPEVFFLQPKSILSLFQNRQKLLTYEDNTIFIQLIVLPFSWFSPFYDKFLLNERYFLLQSIVSPKLEVLYRNLIGKI